MLRRSPLRPARGAALVAACTMTISTVGSIAGIGTGVVHAQTTEEPAAVSAQAVGTPVLKWQQNLPRKVVESSPKVGDVDGDGANDVVVGSWDGNAYAFRGTTGNYVPNWPARTGNKIDSTPAIADLDGNGRNEVYIGSGNWEHPAGGLFAFNPDASQRWRYIANDRVFSNPSIHSAPAIGDITGDRVPDISFGALGLESIHSISRNGARNPGFPFYADDTIFSSPALADLTGDGHNEIIIGGDSFIGGPVNHQGGMVRVLRGDGALLWEYRVNDIVRGGPSVGDIDGDGRPEVVFGGGDYYGGTDSVKVYALDGNGRRKPGWPITTDGVTNASPTLADVSGDGVLDVVIGTWASRFGRGAGGSVYAWKGNGTLLPGFKRPSRAGVVIGQITTADLTGDGRQDLLVPTGAAVFAYDGANGARLFSLAEGQSTGFQNSPLVADVDGNGRLDIVIAGSKGETGVVQRYEMPNTTSKIGRLAWTQHRKDPRNTGAYTSLATARTPASSCPAGTVPESRFRDVTIGNVHRAAINCIVWWDISWGQDGGYSPSGLVHRDQMATFITRTILRSGGTLPANPRDAFSDDNGSMHEASINKLAAVGIVSGQANGGYGPGGRVSRDQMATFLMRAYTYRTGRTPSTAINFFPDEDGNVHEAAINRAAASGVTGGSATGTYQPLTPVERDQMASFLARLLDVIVLDTGAPLP